LIGIKSRSEIKCLEFKTSCSTKCVKIKKIWDTHLSFAMGEPYKKNIDKYLFLEIFKLKTQLNF